MPSGKAAKEVKEKKPTSAAAVSHGFEDTDPKFEYPFSLQARIDGYKRPSELFDKTPPVVVDADDGLESFDLIAPNEHLHSSETMRWVISQIHTLWDICKKDPNKLAQQQAQQAALQQQAQQQQQSSQHSPGNTSVVPGDAEIITNKALLAGRLWRPWEHIYALNKVVKGPFIPAYNPYGKYIVRLYFMGTWRRIVVDDLLPVDENGTLLLPQTTISGELWPMLLTKALMKIMFLE